MGKTLDWITPDDAGRQWGIKARQVQALCVDGKIDGAVKLGRVWLIPVDATKPIDGRTKIAKTRAMPAEGKEEK